MAATFRASALGSATTESGAAVDAEEDMATGRRRSERRRKEYGVGGAAVGFRRRGAW
jgi:hypothetical protein